MTEPSELTGLQIEVAHRFFELEGSRGYLVAGGAALLAADLINRPTEDLDLFGSTPVTSVTQVQDEFVHTLRDLGYDVTVLQEGTTFSRMVIGSMGEEVLVDLAIDCRPARP